MMSIEAYAHVMKCAAATPLRFDPPLDSPEYKAQTAKMLTLPSAPPRNDWPDDVGHLIDMHRALASQAVEYAAIHARKATELAEVATNA